MVPVALAGKIQVVWGQKGREWLDSFTETLDAVTAEWNLTEVFPFPNLTYNFVAGAKRGGGLPVVLKLGVPNPELHTEAACLEIYGGQGAVKLLAYDEAKGALLLERLRPGVALWDTWTVATDDKQTEIAALCMNRIWRPAQGSFPTTADWCQAINAYLTKFPSDGPLPRSLVERAAAMYPDLEKGDRRVLLHGDLHHGNILSGWNEWKVIDPVGVIGDPAFEAGPWLRNPMDRILGVPNLQELVERRLQVIAEITDLDLQRLRQWSFVLCVLSACWSAQEKTEGWNDAIACAEALQKSI